MSAIPSAGEERAEGEKAKGAVRMLLARDRSCAGRQTIRSRGSYTHCGGRSPVQPMRVNAFHEKAGRSQVGSFLSLDKVFLSCRVATVAMLPSALLMSDLVARCMLGVLVSAGAAT